ncbi:hypothetical protein EVAR_101466_1 [Eumeta japonica]|uniref:Uncharacterized protein n=1 Tax=Eumeta variegata TaxID=151549 RepID=A0A4C1T7M0_EUMVA|nr:hypothetical protein EVAR_101466_1 [Eumeta japonica]
MVLRERKCPPSGGSNSNKRQVNEITVIANEENYDCAGDYDAHILGFTSDYSQGRTLQMGLDVIPSGESTYWPSDKQNPRCYRFWYHKEHIQRISGLEKRRARRSGSNTDLPSIKPDLENVQHDQELASF